MQPSTFSIVAHDAASGEWGVGVASKFLAVGAVVPWAQAGAGALATQARANLSYAPAGLALLAEGRGADDVIERLVSADDGRQHRQLGVVDARGRAAAWTGTECLPWAGHRVGRGYCCQGNILAGETVVATMAEAFEHARGPLPERLVSALAAGQAQGGDRRGQQSAALYVAKAGGSYGGALDRYIDLRVDDHPTPLAELGRLLGLHRLYFGATDGAGLVRLSGAVVTLIQQVLARTGHYGGPMDGIYGAATRDAFRRWCSIENFEERWREDDQVDREILEYMRTRHGS